MIDSLFSRLAERASADPDVSYTARLVQKGTKKIAQKVGEEAVEVVIEAIRGDKEKLISESCDLLYHLLVLWHVSGVKPQDIWTQLEQRASDTGLEAKARDKQRQKDLKDL